MSESSLWKEPVVAQLNNQVHLTENYLYLRGKQIRRAFVGVAAENGFSVCKRAEITGANYTVVRYRIFLFFCVFSLYFVLDFYRYYAGSPGVSDSIGIVLLSISALFLLLYVFFKGFLLEFQFPGGSICCSVSGNNEDDVEAFIGQIMKLI